MAEITGDASLTNNQGCKRTDGRGWICRRPVAEGRGYCEAHIQQALLRQKRQPVPDHLKLERAKRTPITPKSVQNSDVGVSNAPVQRNKRKVKETSADVPRKRAKRTANQLGSGKAVLVDLKNGQMEIAPASSPSSSQRKTISAAIKIDASPTVTVFRRPIRSKNSEPIPISVTKKLPSIQENVKAAAANKTQNIKKKCHWCRLTSFCVLVMCLTCKTNFFCIECIDKRLQCKNDVKTKCPVCKGECPCRALTCKRGKPKQLGTKMSDFEKGQQLHIIRKLLPVITQMNQEKINELETEAQNIGTCHDGTEVQIARYTDEKECRICKACIPDMHRSCDFCSFILCLACCHDIRDGYLHSKLQDLKTVRSKSSENKSWRLDLGKGIYCPPKNLGGCEKGFLHLTSLNVLTLTKDLEESAKQILRKLNGFSDSSPCLLCDEAGLYFSNKQEFKNNNNLEHFMKHWGDGKPIIIRDMIQTKPDLNWDFGFMLREYLKTSAKSQNSTETGLCEIEVKRKQILSKHENVWNESLKFKLWFSCDFLQDHFPGHHNMILQSLPLQEYTNPLSGSMNLGAYSPHQTKNTNLSSYVSISYGGLDNPVDPDLLSNLRVHPYDEVNILVHATDRPIREKCLNELKTLMSRYNSQEVVLVSDESQSKSESESESDDEDISLEANSCGAHWDIFRREDVPMLLEYLRKYSNKLSISPKKVVHPLFDEVFYLNDDNKTRLKEEFNVDALSFKQYTGEAVIIPAGCAYQMKKVKSCVHVVYEFMSPESALDSIKVSDEVRLLPLKHKARVKTVQVKKMAISQMQASIEAMREVFVSQTQWCWSFIIARSVKGIFVKLL